jgi:protein SCO1
MSTINEAALYYNMKKRATIYLFVIAVVAFPFCVFGITHWYETHFQRLPVLGPENHVIGNFLFSDQDGKPVDNQMWTGKIVIADYFFTSCPAVCPKMMNQLKRVEAYADKNIIISSFTVDPERDSVGKLKIYADRLGIGLNWHLLTGKKMDLYRFARKDLMIVATDGDGGPADFIHSENLVLIDPAGRIRGYYKGTDEGEVDNLIHDTEKLQIEFKL